MRRWATPAKTMGAHAKKRGDGLPPQRQMKVREQIRATQLINRLEGHVLGGKKGETVPMLDTQVRAALGLLKKCVPDLSVADINQSGSINLTVTITKFTDAPDRH